MTFRLLHETIIKLKCKLHSELKIAMEVQSDSSSPKLFTGQ